jgi:signal transduction histidine kinase
LREKPFPNAIISYVGSNLLQGRANSLIRQTLAVGADANVALSQRLTRMAALARDAFGAERAWIVNAEAGGMEHHLAEVCDPHFPGAAATGEEVPQAAFAAQVAILQREHRPVLFTAPFPELDAQAREFVLRYDVKASAQVMARASRAGVHWLVGLDFCREIPPWGREETELLGEFADATAMSIESAQLFQEVADAKRELEIVFETQLDGVAMIARDGTAIRNNQAWKELVGGRWQTTPCSTACCVAGIDLGGETCSLDQARASGEGRVVGFSASPEGGRWLQCMVRQVPGAPDLFIQVLRDITEQRVLSERVAQQARLESLGTLAGGIAHEFNNILMTMVPAVARLRRARSSDPDAVSMIDAAVQRASELTRRMLGVSRQRAGFVGRSDLTQVLADVVAVLRSSLPKNIHVNFKTSDELGWVGLEGGALQSVFLNLATNARDAMPDGGDMTFTAYREQRDDGPVAVVSVSDTGIGIAAADVPRIFDPFFTTKSAGEGTGLGLALVHRLVTEAHGNVMVGSSGPGEGATFAVSLPIVAPSAHIQLAPEAPHPARLDGTRVLVVDDEAMIRDGMALLLAEAGAEVVACATAEEALFRVGDCGRPFDVAVVDFGLPGMDGCTLLGQLLDLRPELVAVLASGYTDTRRFTALQDSGVLFFQKPFEVADLIRAVAARLR